MDNSQGVLCFTQIGQCHIQDKMECEDVCVTVENQRFQFLGLADGQSGKKYCKLGAKAALTAIAQYVENKTVQNLMKYRYLDEIQYEIVQIIRGTLALLAKENDCDISELSSTIVATVIDKDTKNYLIIHLGDGAVVGVKKEEQVVMLSAPENGITQQYTWLTTSLDAMHHLQITRGSTKELKRMVLMTDGVTMLCRGRRITKKAEQLLCEVDDSMAIIDEIKNGKPQDDASCIIVDL